MAVVETNDSGSSGCKVCNLPAFTEYTCVCATVDDSSVSGGVLGGGFNVMSFGLYQVDVGFADVSFTVVSI